MCGRFVLLTDLSIIAEAFQIGQIACEHQSGNNISPGQSVIAVTRQGNSRQRLSCQWGLIPAWAKDPAIGHRLFNARAETIAEKPSFRNAFKNRRCLIVADGFYEWQNLGGTARKPWFIHLKSGEPFGFAGLYETWVPPGGGSPLKTCTIITTTPNELIEPIHHRMPVILPKKAEDIWLDPSCVSGPDLLGLLKPYPSGEMTCRQEYPVTQLFA